MAAAHLDAQARLVHLNLTLHLERWGEAGPVLRPRHCRDGQGDRDRGRLRRHPLVSQTRTWALEPLEPAPHPVQGY